LKKLKNQLIPRLNLGKINESVKNTLLTYTKHKREMITEHPIECSDELPRIKIFVNLVFEKYISL